MKLDQMIVQHGNKTFYRDGDMLIKMFDKSTSTADVLNEALNQARVQETGLNIPKIREVTKVDGKWAIVMDYIAGKTLDTLMKENPDKMKEYLNKFVDLQLKMHKEKCPLLTKLKDKMNRKISATKLEATIRYELHMRLEGMPKHMKLCHGDFCPSNIIVGDDGVDYIIDWSHATQGNASADTARTYLTFCLTGDQKLADQYLALFCKKSDTAKQYVQKWMPIVAASQSVKEKADEMELLMKWASVVEYE